MPLAPRRSRDLLPCLLLALLPLVLLGDSVFLGNRFLPFDLAEFPPVSTTLTKADVAALRQTANYDPTEPPILFAPGLEQARQSLGRGEWPHWTPYVRGGAPLVADGLLGLLDPFKAPALLFEDPADGLLFVCCAMFALAGLSMYGLLRTLDLAIGASLFGAVAFAWSGTMTANAHWYMRMEPLALLPLACMALLRLERARGHRRGVWAVLLAAAVGLSWSGSFPPFALPCSVVIAAFALVLLARGWRTHGRATALTFGLWAAAGALLGLSLAAGTIVQQALFYPESNRQVSATLSSASRLAFDPMGLLGLLLPEAFTHPGDRLMPSGKCPLAFLLFSRADWETGAILRPDQNYNFTEYALFPGTLTLLLALVGLLGKGAKWKWLPTLAVALLLLTAMGAGPLRWLFALPGSNAVPPYRLASLCAAFTPILAALGAHRLRQDGAASAMRRAALAALALGGALLLWSQSLDRDGDATEQRWLAQITERYRPIAAQFDPNLAPAALTPELVRAGFFTGYDDDGNKVDLLRRSRQRLQRNLDRSGGLLLLGAALLAAGSWRRRGRGLPAWTLAPLVLLCGAELWLHGRTLVHGQKSAHPVDSPVHGFLREQRDAAAAQGGFLVARANPQGGDAFHLPPGTLAKDRIRDLHYYAMVDRYSSAPLRALYGAAFMTREHWPQALPDDERLMLPWFDAIGLRYLLTTAPMQHAGARVGPQLAGPGGEFFVYERPRAMPRAWLVPRLRAVGDDEAMVRAALRPDFAPNDAALVTDDAARALPPLPENVACKGRTVTFVHEDQKRLTLRVGDGLPGYLVLADSFWPGWTVTCDGQELPIGRGNVFMRIVPVPAGERVLEFRFRTPGLVPGLAIAASAAVLALLLLAALLRPGRAMPPAQDGLPT